MSAPLASLSQYKRIVIKIGSALLVDRGSGLKHAWLDAVCDDIAALRARGSRCWSCRLAPLRLAARC